MDRVYAADDDDQPQSQVLLLLTMKKEHRRFKRRTASMAAPFPGFLDVVTENLIGLVHVGLPASRC